LVAYNIATNIYLHYNIIHRA